MMRVVSAHKPINRKRHSECMGGNRPCDKLPTSCYWLELMKRAHKVLHWGILRYRSASCIPVLFAFLCLYDAVLVRTYLPSPLQMLGDHVSLERVSWHLAPTVPQPKSVTFWHTSSCPWSTTTPTDDNKWTMGLSPVRECFIRKTKTFHITDSGGPSWTPPITTTTTTRSVVNPVYLHCHDSTPPGWPWSACTQLSQLSTQPRQGKLNKKRGTGTKSYFYGKLRSDCGAISQVHLNKSIKAYPNMKKKDSNSPLSPLLSPFFPPPFTFGSRSRGVYPKRSERR